MPELNVSSYPVDLTGVATTNRVTERVTITVDRTQIYHYVIPRHAPFYNHPVSIRKLTTDETLQLGKDFFHAAYDPVLSRYTRDDSSIYGAIVFLNQDSGGDYEITYQTIGGDQTLSDAEYVQVMANRLANPFRVKWREVINKPITWNPVPHPHPTDETGSYDELVSSFTTLNQTIANYLATINLDNPSVMQLLITTINQGQLLAKFMAKLDTLDRDIRNGTLIPQPEPIDIVQPLANLKKDLTTVINGVRDNLTSAVSEFNTGQSDQDTRIDELSSTLSQYGESLGNVLRDVGRRLSEFMEQLNTRMNGYATDEEVANALSTLTNSFNSTIEALERKVNGLSGDAVEFENLTVNHTTTTSQMKADVISPKRDIADVQLTGNQVFQVSRQNGKVYFKIQHDRIDLNAPVHLTTPIVFSDNTTLQVRNGQLEYSGKLKVKQLIVGENTDLTKAVMRDGDIITGHLMTGNYQSNTLLPNGSGNVAVTMNTFNGHPFSGYGLQYQATVNGNSLKRMLAYDVSDPFALYIQSWDSRNGTYLGRRPVAPTIVEDYNTTYNADLRQVPSFRLFKDNIVPVAKENINFVDMKTAYGKVPYIQNNGRMELPHHIRFHNHQTGSTQFINANVVQDSALGLVLSFDKPILALNLKVTSDARFKSEIELVRDSLDIVKQLSGYQYRLKQDGQLHYGVLAQEVKEVLPHAVSTINNTQLTVDYNAVTAVLINAINELDKRLEKLEQVS